MIEELLDVLPIGLIVTGVAAFIACCGWLVGLHGWSWWWATPVSCAAAAAAGMAAGALITGVLTVLDCLDDWFTDYQISRLDRQILRSDRHMDLNEARLRQANRNGDPIEAWRVAVAERDAAITALQQDAARLDQQRDWWQAKASSQEARIAELETLGGGWGNETETNLRAKLTAREQTIGELREKGRRAVAERNRWEAAAKAHETEIAVLKAAGGGADKFVRAKRAVAKCLHPNAYPGTDKIEVAVRAKVFQELWPEIEKIEAR